MSGGPVAVGGVHVLAEVTSCCCAITVPRRRDVMGPSTPSPRGLLHGHMYPHGGRWRHSTEVATWFAFGFRRRSTARLRNFGRPLALSREMALMVRTHGISRRMHPRRLLEASRQEHEHEHVRRLPAPGIRGASSRPLDHCSHLGSCRVQCRASTPGSYMRGGSLVTGKFVSRRLTLWSGGNDWAHP